MNYPCKHFEDCGGCSLQHLAEGQYYAFKQDILRQVLQRLGCGDAAGDIVRIGAGQRRRVEFKISVNKGAVSLGFYAAKTHEVVDLQECLVASENIAELIPQLRDLISGLKKPGNLISLQITELGGGFDFIFEAKSKIIDEDRGKILEVLAKDGRGRVASRVDGEISILSENKNNIVLFGKAQVEPPIDAFLQATEKAQNFITEFILQNIQASKYVADLYSGCGAYSFPIAQAGARVEAFEGSYEMVMAMNNAARRAELEEVMKAEVRDLYKKPLKPAELKYFDAVIINPPRNGAGPQVKNIADSGARKAVMISCNPKTFESDARQLLAAGYTLKKAVPIDQFYWTEHLEVVAVFTLL